MPLTRFLPRPRNRRARWNTLALGVAATLTLALVGFGVFVFDATRRAGEVRDAPVPAAPPQAADATETSPARADAAPATTTAAGADPAPAPPSDRAARPRAFGWGGGAAGTDAAVPPAGPPGRPLETSLQQALQRFRSLTTPAVPRYVPAIPEAALGFAWPLRGYVTSAFDDDHPLGIDIAPLDTMGLVLVSRDGVVVYAGGDPCCGYGHVVIVDHGGGLTSIYGHLRDAPLVRAGERVLRGTVLGIAGSTGNSRGVHLHFEVRFNGLPVDPRAVLTAGELTPLQPRPVVAAAEPAQADGQAATPIAGASQPVPADPPRDGADATRDRERVAPPATPPVDRQGAASGAPAAATPAASADITPTAAPEPSATPAPATAATATPAPSPVSNAATGAPSPSPSAAPAAATTTPSPVTGAPTPAPTPAGTPSATATPSPSPTPGLASATPTPAETPAASPTPPACDTVKLKAGEPRSASAGAAKPFVTLELESGALESAMAQRCGDAQTATVTARPDGEQRCTAALYDAAGLRQRTLTPRLQSGDEAGTLAAATEFRWSVDVSDLGAGSVVRLTCVPAVSDEGR